MSAVLKFRPANSDDEPFLKSLRAQFDSERLYVRYWGPGNEQLKKNLLDLQYNAHNRHYQNVKNKWETKDNIIELDGSPIGRFIVCGDGDEIRLADILIQSQYRGMGIGQAVLDTTKAECAQSKRPLRLHVDIQNPAIQFYLSQGFRAVKQTQTHCLMEWRPGNVPGAPRYFT